MDDHDPLDEAEAARPGSAAPDAAMTHRARRAAAALAAAGDGDGRAPWPAEAARYRERIGRPDAGRDAPRRAQWTGDAAAEDGDAGFATDGGNWTPGRPFSARAPADGTARIGRHGVPGMPPADPAAPLPRWQSAAAGWTRPSGFRAAAPAVPARPSPVPPRFAPPAPAAARPPAGPDGRPLAALRTPDGSGGAFGGFANRTARRSGTDAALDGAGAPLATAVRRTDGPVHPASGAIAAPDGRGGATDAPGVQRPAGGPAGGRPARDAFGAARREAEAEARHDALARAYAAKQDYVRAELPDYDRVVGAERIPVSQALAAALVESEHTARLEYHLAKNPERLAELNRLSPRDAARAVGRLEAAISAAGENRATRAPAPLAPLRGGAAGPLRSLAELAESDNAADYIELRRAQRRA